ncbi:MAG: histidine kinase dimerization/phosphoacceptor domain -containing protein [bacterium]
MTEKPKILIVDDKPENLFALDESLQELEAEIITATNGNDALKLVLNHDFALALLDVQMPVMNGYELAELMRSDERAQQIPIIFFSAIHSDDYHLFKGYNSGAVDFLVKPYHPSILLNKCRVFIKLYTQKREIEMAKQYIDNILASIHEVLIVTSPNGFIEKVNHATDTLLGYRENELIGRPLEVIFQETAESGSSHTEQTLIASDGRKVPALLSCSTLRDEQGKVQGMVYVATDIGDRKRAEEQIKASLAEKELLLRELYHRTKNNMQVIASLLALQASYTKDEQVLKIFRETENRIKSMALVHKHLYQSRNLAGVDLKNYFADVISSLVKSYQGTCSKISLILMADEGLFASLDAAVPCGLAVSEIITNALQHAFPDNREGAIRVSLHRGNKDEIDIRVADNGIGMPEGFDFRNTKSLGLQIVVNLVENQLQGKVDMILNEGVEFQIRFNDPYHPKRV